MRYNKFKDKISKLFIHFFMLIYSIIIIFPLLWILVTAFKEKREVFSEIPTFIPKNFIFSNFSEVWTMVPFSSYYINTVMLVFGLLAVQLITVILAAYAFGKMNFKGKNILFMLLLTQLMISPQSVFLPNYLTIANMGLLDTKTAIALPYIASAFGTFLLRQAFMAIPKELEEAAYIDGCQGLRWLYYIGIPLVKPSILAFSLVSMTHHWNEFFWPMIVTDTPKARTLTIGLGIFAQTAEGGAEWTLLMAATLLTIGPLLILFLMFQKKFINSFMHSGLKG